MVISKIQKHCEINFRSRNYLFEAAENTFLLARFLENFQKSCPALLDLFIFSDASICSTMAFPPLAKSDHVAQFPLAFCQTQNRIPCFIA